MQLTNEWYCYPSALDKKTCNKIKSISKNSFSKAKVARKKIITEEDRITGYKPDYGTDKKSRISDVSWTNEQRVIDIVWPYMLEANEKAGWNFDVTAVEDMQVTRYKPGGFYGWHQDGGADCLSTYDRPNNKFLNGNARKLSMTVLLNGNYQGGEFQFSSYSKGNHEIASPKFNTAGSVIVFPSFIEHRVAPVTKGTRYSLVAWFVGPPFK